MDNARVVFADVELPLSVRRFRVEEQLNQPFRIELEGVAPDDALDLGDRVGRRAEFILTGVAERRWIGRCERFRMVRAEDDGMTTYALSIVPSLWRLSQRSNHRLFQHVSIPSIVRDRLDAWGIAHRWQIEEADYPPLELRTQYGEDDLAFVHRLLEEAGISYRFETGDDDMCVVFDDAPAQRDARPPLSFVDMVEQAHRAPTDFVTELEVDARALPERWTLRDYDPRRPRLPLAASQTAGREREAEHEQYRYLPGAFNVEREADLAAELGTPVADQLGVARQREAQGQRLARVMTEAAHARRRGVSFRASTPALPPGTVMSITGHPRADVSGCALMSERLLLEGEVAQPEAWRYVVEAVYGDVPYRPPFTVDKPRIYGLQTAVVVGPGSDDGEAGRDLLDEAAVTSRLVDDEIYVDELGRVRVQFPWDREGRFDAHSSIWIRVSQGWAGGGYGMFTIPRVGHEVLIAFLDGDPDAPMVVGRVHNAVEPVPFKLPDNKTVSTWKTSSSPGGGGFNELRFDDATDREHVFMQAQKDMDHLVKNDLKQAVGRDASRSVQNRDALMVGKDRVKVVNHNEIEVSGLNRSAVVGVNRTSTVGVEDSTIVGTRWSVTVGRGISRRLTRELDRLLESQVAGVARSAATSMLGRLPFDPLASVAEAALSSFGAQAVSKLRGVLDALDGTKTDPGPPPTGIEMTDRYIELSTGEAKIILDGPNVSIVAQGAITFHAHDSVSLLGEKEVAIAARDRAALVSATNDVIVQAARDVHLNPHDAPSRPLEEAERLDADVGPPPPRCEVCGEKLVVSEEGLVCPHVRESDHEED